VAVHRRHHAYADKPGDPHSPVIFGLNKVLLEGYELYVAAARDPRILESYGRGTPDDWLERNVYGRFTKTGLVIMILAQLTLFGVPAVVMVAVQLAAQPFFAGGVINGLGHRLGYRSFETESAATNIVPWGLLLGGEELHNNHHAFPRSARFAVQRWEVDPGWLWIKLFAALGLARVLGLVPRPKLLRERRALDAETARALFVNRMHVLRDYARRVVRPVCRELRQAEPRGSLPRRLARLFVRHPARLDAGCANVRRALLGRYEVLRTIVEHRERLQRAWNESAANPARAAAQLREWCREAEASGIRALQDFSLSLQRYTLAPQPG
jgi:stearoyl-CoA desaturase (delta-9 desaturase)